MNSKHANENLFAIECEDILLREYVPDDLDGLHQLTLQPHFYEFLTGWNVTREQRREWMDQYEIPENKRFLQAVSEGMPLGELRLRLAIVSRATGALIGVCGTGIKEELPPPNREIYYGISAEHRNKGCTTQAAKGLIEYLFASTDTAELIAIARVTNLTSNRVIRKCGFAYRGEIELETDRYHYYVIEKG